MIYFRNNEIDEFTFFFFEGRKIKKKMHIEPETRNFLMISIGKRRHLCRSGNTISSKLAYAIGTIKCGALQWLHSTLQCQPRPQIINLMARARESHALYTNRLDVSSNATIFCREKCAPHSSVTLFFFFSPLFQTLFSPYVN